MSSACKGADLSRSHAAFVGGPGHVIFFGVRIRLGTIFGRFSIIYFRGLGLRIRVWVRVRARVRVLG